MAARPKGNGILADWVRQKLEEEIIAGILKPGDRLEESSLAERFQVSRTPVREALGQLISAGLASSKPHHGAVVMQMTIQDLIEMFEVMATLEGLCANLAARRMTPEEIKALGKIHRSCAELARANDVNSYYIKNKSFHEAIYAGSHNAHLLEMTRRLRNRVSAYRRYQPHRPSRLRRSYSEHDAVYSAIRKGDPVAAQRAMELHVTVQGDVLADLAIAVTSVTKNTRQTRLSAAFR